jgi:hypothetical protein
MQTKKSSEVVLEPLMYLVKLSRPELSNTRRELLKIMDGGTDNHFNVLKRVITYVIQSKKGKNSK